MKFRKKPVVIEAVQWNGDNGEDIGRLNGKSDFEQEFSTPSRLMIKTLEGVMFGEIGDWIICGVQGELYPCKPDIFEVTYEPVDED